MRIALCVISPVKVIAKIVVVGIKSVVYVCLPISLSPLLCIKHFQLVGIKRGGYTGIEINLHLAVLAFLGGDDYYTIGST